LLTCWEFHLAQFKAFWKQIWTCIGLPPNMYLNCWTRSRRRVMSEWSTRGFKRTQNSFER
jgi:hypothetical protein